MYIYIYIYINNQYTAQNQTIANSFNNYFINVESSLAKNITSDIDPTIYYVQYYDKSIEKYKIPEIHTCEIISVITSLSNSSSGYDEMPASIIKRQVVYFVQPLTYLINLSIAQGTVPDELKIANVLPIYKN